MAKPELRDHRKFLKLCRILQAPAPHVLGYLDFMWHRGYQTGNPFLGDADDVEAAAAFPGERGTFAVAAAASGFLDVDAAGNFVIHDLYEHAPKYAKMRIERAGFRPNTARNNDEDDDSVSDHGTVVPGRVTKVPRHGTNGTGRVPPNPKPKPNQKDKRHSAAAAAGDVETPEEAPPGPAKQRKARDPIPKPDPKPREPWPMYDAVAEVTGCSGSHVAKVARELVTDESPSVTPDEIREFGRRFTEFCPHALIDGVPRLPNVGELRKYVTRVRSPTPTGLFAPPRPVARYPTKAETELAEFAARMDSVARGNQELAARGRHDDRDPEPTDGGGGEALALAAGPALFLAGPDPNPGDGARPGAA